jgi:anion-transporting  ArsA/GET3 family ATPase
VIIVAGKGGVGKTVVSGALARAAASAGHSVSILEVDGRAAVAKCFAAPPFGYDEVELLAADDAAGRGVVRGRTITPDAALVEYLEDHGLRRVARRLASTGVLEVVATATPGIKDLLVMGKVKQLEQAQQTDLTIVDAPAAGHAVNFLDAARVLFEAVTVGPIRHQASDVLALLRDPARCQVVLVTLPEETPVNELVETAYRLEDQVGVALGPVVVNAVLPHLDRIECDPSALIDTSRVPSPQLQALRDAGGWWSGRFVQQQRQLQRLADALPLPQLHLPQIFSDAVTTRESQVLADAVTQGVMQLAHG